MPLGEAESVRVVLERVHMGALEAIGVGRVRGLRLPLNRVPSTPIFPYVPQPDFLHLRGPALPVGSGTHK
jgi:hypothetical protein